MQQWTRDRLVTMGLEARFQENRFVGWDNVIPAKLRFLRPVLPETELEYHPVMWSPSIDGAVTGILEPAGEMLTYEQYTWRRYAVRDETGQVRLYLLSQPEIYSWVQTLDDETELAPHMTVNAHSQIEQWLAEGQEIVVEASMENAFYPDTPLVNVVADFSVPPKLLVTCHLDSIHNGVGAHDNASGVVAMLDLAVRAKDLPSGVRFVAFDGEELNKIGAYRYAAHLAENGELDKIHMQINFDSVAVGEYIYVLTAPAIFEQVKALLADLPVDVSTREEFRQFDTWPFMKRGLPVVQIGSTAKGDNYRYFNSPKDTVGGNGYELRSELIDTAVAVAERLAVWALGPGDV